MKFTPAELRALLVDAVLALAEAERMAHKDAWRCSQCGHADTLRIRQAEQSVLMYARQLGAALADQDGAGA